MNLEFPIKLDLTKCRFFEISIFVEGVKPRNRRKTIGARRKPTTNSTHLWHQVQDLNLGHNWWEASILTTGPPLRFTPASPLLTPKNQAERLLPPVSETGVGEIFDKPIILSSSSLSYKVFGEGGRGREMTSWLRTKGSKTIFFPFYDFLRPHSGYKSPSGKPRRQSDWFINLVPLISTYL